MLLLHPLAPGKYQEIQSMGVLVGKPGAPVVQDRQDKHCSAVAPSLKTCRAPVICPCLTSGLINSIVKPDFVDVALIAHKDEAETHGSRNRDLTYNRSDPSPLMKLLH